MKNSFETIIQFLYFNRYQTSRSTQTFVVTPRCLNHCIICLHPLFVMLFQEIYVTDLFRRFLHVVSHVTLLSNNLRGNFKLRTRLLLGIIGLFTCPSHSVSWGWIQHLRIFRAPGNKMDHSNTSCSS